LQITLRNFAFDVLFFSLALILPAAGARLKSFSHRGESGFTGRMMGVVVGGGREVKEFPLPEAKR
jgi:hypothetical protein